jgi:hypothetical protein
METNKAGVIIADTSGLVSLFSSDDRNHAEALNAAKRLQHENKDILSSTLSNFRHLRQNTGNENPRVTPPERIVSDALIAQHLYRCHFHLYTRVFTARLATC